MTGASKCVPFRRPRSSYPDTQRWPHAVLGSARALLQRGRRLSRHGHSRSAAKYTMTFRTRHISHVRAGSTAALLLALLPLTASSVRAPRGRTSVASGGAVGHPLASGDAATEPMRAAVRRTLAEHASGTYIAEMLAERDSALARWPDRAGEPLMVWIQSASDIAGWSD